MPQADQQWEAGYQDGWDGKQAKAIAPKPYADGWDTGNRDRRHGVLQNPIKIYWGEQRDLTTLTRREVQEWINSCAKAGLKSSTIGHHRCLLSRLWRVLEDLDLDNGLHCPLQRLRMPKKRTDKRKISEEVVDEVGTKVSEHDRDLIDLALNTFLRRLEVFRLTINDLIVEPDPNNPGEFLYSIRVITSKTGKGRIVPLNDEARDIVYRRIAAATAAGQLYLFGDQREERHKAATSWAGKVWYPLIKKIGKGGHFHGLRHRGAHLAWKNGAPIEATSKMLGHSNIPQTEHYIGVTEDAMWDAARAVSKGLAHKTPAAQPAPTEPVRAAKQRETAWLGF